MIERSDIHVMSADVCAFDIDTPPSYEYLDADGRLLGFNDLIDYLCKNEKRNIAICEKAKSLVKEERRKIVILTNRVEHCEHLAELLCSMGVNARSVTGKTAKKKRVDTIDNPEKWDVLCASVSLLKEGLDIIELDTVMLVVPVKDRSTIVQSCGRCERYLEGKNQPIFMPVRDKAIEYCVAAVKKQIRYIVNRR